MLSRQELDNLLAQPDKVLVMPPERARLDLLAAKGFKVAAGGSH